MLDMIASFRPEMPEVSLPTARSGAARSVVPGRAKRGTRVLGSRFSQVNYDRDFGRVEAVVSITLQYDPSLPPRHETLFVGVPVDGPRKPGELRKRLTDVTVKIAVLMHRTDRGASLTEF